MVAHPRSLIQPMPKIIDYSKPLDPEPGGNLTPPRPPIRTTVVAGQLDPEEDDSRPRETVRIGLPAKRGVPARKILQMAKKMLGFGS